MSNSSVAPDQKPNTRKGSSAPFLSEEWVRSLITPKVIKDIKFSFSGFIVLVLILFHYAWIMKKLLINPYIPTQTIVMYFAIFGANVVFLVYVLLYVIYPIVFKEEIEEERLDKFNKKE